MRSIVELDNGAVKRRNRQLVARKLRTSNRLPSVTFFVNRLHVLPDRCPCSYFVADNEVTFPAGWLCDNIRCRSLLILRVGKASRRRCTCSGARLRSPRESGRTAPTRRERLPVLCRPCRATEPVGETGRKRAARALYAGRGCRRRRRAL